MVISVSIFIKYVIAAKSSGKMKKKEMFRTETHLLLVIDEEVMDNWIHCNVTTIIITRYENLL